MLWSSMGDMWGVPCRRGQNPPASVTLCCGGTEMWEGGSVLGEAKCCVSTSLGLWPSLLTSRWGFKFGGSCFWLCSVAIDVVVRKKGKKGFHCWSVWVGGPSAKPQYGFRECAIT